MRELRRCWIARWRGAAAAASSGSRRLALQLGDAPRARARGDVVVADRVSADTFAGAHDLWDAVLLPYDGDTFVLLGADDGGRRCISVNFALVRPRGRRVVEEKIVIGVWCGFPRMVCFIWTPSPEIGRAAARASIAISMRQWFFKDRIGCRHVRTVLQNIESRLQRILGPAAHLLIVHKQIMIHVPHLKPPPLSHEIYTPFVTFAVDFSRGHPPSDQDCWQ